MKILFYRTLIYKSDMKPRYLGNKNEREVHDLDNEQPNYQISVQSDTVIFAKDSSYQPSFARKGWQLLQCPVSRNHDITSEAMCC